MQGTDTMPRDGGGTENIQTSATDGAARTEPSSLELCRVVTEENEVKYGCRQKKKMQTSAKSIFQFFARLHFLTQIFAHFCILCVKSKFRVSHIVSRERKLYQVIF